MSPKADFYSGKKVLITGGSSGIGLAAARQLSARGASLWLVGRDAGKLRAAAAELESTKANPSAVIGFTAADVSDADQARRAVADATAAFGAPEVLINCAGVAHPGYFEQLDAEIFRSMMDVNYFGTLHAIRAALPAMLARGSGWIHNVSSMAAILCIFGYTAYGASKFAVRGLSDALRAELKPRGIRISVSFPPDTDTPQLAYESKIKPFETKVIAGNSAVVPPERVARDILSGIERNRYLILTGAESRFYYWLAQSLGPWQYPVMDLFVADAIRKKERAAG